ncbi:MAG: hypothetical protein KatS3mg110_1817 [Pirellulaceae bacterium]|nr:MAG: hypothetical protein KatS3mg110_1817 [Pirellulaceae bacterium]
MLSGQFEPRAGSLPFERRLAQRWPPTRWLDHRSVLAVSGGPDSTALARALCRICPDSPCERFVIVHVNHGWRGAESDRDEQFVQRLAQELGLEFIGYRLEPPATASGLGREGLARQERYRRLLESARRTGARYVLTAHTRDDQIETVLLRIFRGTGVAGLGGMPVVRRLDPHVSLVRPILWASRHAVLRYLGQLHQNWCSDSTNPDPTFARGFLRSELLPVLRRFYGNKVDEAVWRLAEDASELQRLVEVEVRQKMEQCRCRCGPDQVCIDRRAWLQLAEPWQRLILRQIWQDAGWPQRHMTRRHWRQLACWCRQRSEVQRDLPGKVRLYVDSQLIRLIQHSP